MDLISFDIWGNYAYFRRGYTTTSTLSYPFPSRTTIAGIIAGILGYPRDSYYDYFKKENSKIGLRIMNPIKSVTFTLNYLNTTDMKKKEIVKYIDNNENYYISFKDKEEEEKKKNIYKNYIEILDNSMRVQVPAQFLKDVKYRIYVGLDDSEKMNKLHNLLKEHKSIYTPCLGISECLANFNLVGYEHSVKPIEGEYVDIDSVVLKESGNIKIEKDKEYAMVRSPGFFNDDRSVSSFLDYYYERNGNSILLDLCEYYKVGDDNVILY